MYTGAFYRFAGSEAPQIDSHLIHQARDLWSWFWIGLETALLYFMTGLVLVAASAYQTGFTVIVATVVTASLGLPIVRNQCRQYAIAQVKATANGDASGAVVRGVMPLDLKKRTVISDGIRAGSLDDFFGKDNFLLGARMAERFGLGTGDRL